MTETEKQAVDEYLRLVKESIDPDAVVASNGNIHFDEYDEYEDRYIPVVVTAEEAYQKIMDMYDLGGC